MHPYVLSCLWPSGPALALHCHCNALVSIGDCELRIYVNTIRESVTSVRNLKWKVRGTCPFLLKASWNVEWHRHDEMTIFVPTHRSAIPQPILSDTCTRAPELNGSPRNDPSHAWPAAPGIEQWLQCYTTTRILWSSNFSSLVKRSRQLQCKFASGNTRNEISSYHWN